MSHQEEITRLTGKLIFQADSKPLLALERVMDGIIKKLSVLDKNLESFNRLSSKALKVRVDTRDLDKLKAELNSLEKRSSTAKVKVALQQHALEKHKQNPSATPASVATHEAKLAKAQAAQAMVDKRVAQAQAQVLKNQGILAAITQKAQVHGAVLAQKASALNFQTQQANQSSQKHQASMQTAANRHTIQQQQIAKNAHHAANGYKYTYAGNPKAKGYRGNGIGSGGLSAAFGGHGGSGIAKMLSNVSAVGNASGLVDAVGGIVGAFNPVLAALGGFGIAVGAAAGLVSVLNEHLDKRQESVTDSEQFALALKSFSEDPKEQKMLADAYINTNKKYALQTNVDTARQYSMQARTLMSVGKSAPQAAHMIDSQDAMIRAANMSAQSQNIFKTELNHLIVGGKGSLTSAQQRSLWNSLGALGPLVQQQTAIAMGYKGKPEGAAEYLKHNKKRMSADNVYAGMDTAAQQSQGIIDRHTNSVEAKQIDLDTTKYLQNVGIETNNSMLSATKDRIAAEEELAKAMLPVNKAFAEFDQWLFKLDSWIIRITAHLLSSSENADKNTPEARAKRIQDAADHGGSLAYQGNVVTKDRDGNLINSDGTTNRGLFGDIASIFGKDKPEDSTPALFAAPAMPSVQQLPDFNGLTKNFSNMQDVLNSYKTPKDIAYRQQTINAPITINTNNTNNLNTTVQGADANEINKILEEGLKNNATMMPYHAKTAADTAVMNLISATRAQQAEGG